MNQSLRPRSTYSFSRNGASSMNRRQGAHIVKNNLVDHISPCWGDGVTVIRPLPLLETRDDGAKQWTPYRRTGQPDSLNFGDWIRRYDAVRKFGDPGVTMIISNPDDPNEPPLDETPSWVLYNAIKRAIREKVEQPGWASLLEGGNNRGAVLSRPTEVYLVPCLLMQNKMEKYMPPKGFNATDKPQLMELSSGAGNTLIAEMNKPREGSQAVDGDWENMYENGDPVSLEYGRYITFYRLSDGDPRVANTQQPQTQHGQALWTSQRQNPRQQQQRSREVNGFGCFLETTFDQNSANLSQYANELATKSFSWDDVLWFPTLEEQARILADKFPANAIMYAWDDHRSWIPDGVREKAVAAHSVGAPAGGWTQFGPNGQVQPPQNQQYGMQQPGTQQFGAGGFAPPAPTAIAPTGGQGFMTSMQPGMFAPPQQPQGQFAPPQQTPQPQGQFAPPPQPQGQFAPPPQPQGQFAPPTQPDMTTSMLAQQPQQAALFAGQVAQPQQMQPQQMQPQQMQPQQMQPQQMQPQQMQPQQPTIGAADASQATWMGGGQPAVNAMGQSPTGFAPAPAAQFQQPQQPQQPGQFQQPQQYQQPQQQAPVGRVAAALAAAQAAAASAAAPVA